MTDIDKLQAAQKLVDSVLGKYKATSTKFKPSPKDQFIRMGLVRTYNHIEMILNELRESK